MSELTVWTEEGRDLARRSAEECGIDRYGLTDPARLSRLAVLLKRPTSPNGQRTQVHA